jgi:hypothetical protein
VRCAETHDRVGAALTVEHIVPVTHRHTAEAVRDDVEPLFPRDT